MDKDVEEQFRRAEVQGHSLEGRADGQQDREAKQGITVVRIRVGRGGMRKQRPVAGRRPKHLGVVHIKQGISMRKVAERRVNEKYPNMEVLGSYYVHKDGMYYWFEVIMADPSHPAISKDKEMRGKMKAFAK